MSKTTNQYYEMYTISKPDANQLVFLDKVREMLKALGHEKLDEVEEGKKKLAYPISGYREGVYHKIYFKMGEAKDLKPLTLFLHETMNAENLRYLIVTCSGEYKPENKGVGA